MTPCRTHPSTRGQFSCVADICVTPSRRPLGGRLLRRPARFDICTWPSFGLSKEAHRLSVLSCAGAHCVEKLFELPLLSRHEVGQYLLVGDPCGCFRAFQELLALGGELSRQRSTRG